MIVVADSGSTKCDWIFVEGDTKVQFSTMGFNPMFHTSHQVAFELRKNNEFLDYASRVSNVYFYGAGCSSTKLQTIIKTGLTEIFPNAQIDVQHDLDGAVYAACQGKPGIACILGTGSNSAYFDGQQIHEEVPALGYIMGDEGSGSYFGKQLLAAYFYKQMPDGIRERFKQAFPKITDEDVFDHVYSQPHANVYLASFMRFLSDNKDEKYVQDMVYKGLSKFIDIHIWRYRGYKEVPVHFVGSIAYHFEDLLRKVAAIHHIKVGRIIQKPVDTLVEHHSQ